MECERGRISLSNETANYLLANGRPLAERNAWDAANHLYTNKLGGNTLSDEFISLLHRRVETQKIVYRRSLLAAQDAVEH